MSIEVREDVLFKGNSGDSLRKRSFHHVKGDDNHRTHCVPPMSIKAWHCWFYCQTHCHIHPPQAADATIWGEHRQVAGGDEENHGGQGKNWHQLTKQREESRTCSGYSEGKVRRRSQHCFGTAEQVSEIQADLLRVAIELATGGSALSHVGTGGGGFTSDIPGRKE